MFPFMWEKRSMRRYQNPNLPFDLGIRQNLVEQLKHTMEEMGKKVQVVYY